MDQSPPYRNQSGFTLVELSVALVIIALLSAGIVIGRDLIRTAEIHKQIKQIEEYKLALSIFRDKYGGMPGDMPNATHFFTNTTNGNGSGIINIYLDGPSKFGDISYDYQWGYGQFLPGGIDPPDVSYVEWSDSGRTDEILQAFVQLSQAGLIKGGYDGSLALGRGIPRTYLDQNHGFFIGSSANFYTFLNSRMPLTNDYRVGNNLLWFIACSFQDDESFHNLLVHMDDRCGTFKPVDMQQIDTKMDDGMPLTGNVIGFGGCCPDTPELTECLTLNTPEANSVYNASSSQARCQAAFVLD